MPEPKSFKTHQAEYTRIIADLYGFKADEIALESIAEGIQDYNFFIKRAGKGGEKLAFLSIKRSEQGEIDDPAHLEKILTIQQKLAENGEARGLLIPKPQASINKSLLGVVPAKLGGQPLPAEMSDVIGKNIVMYSLLKGKAVENPTLKDFANMGEQLGKFYQTGNEVLAQNPDFKQLENPVSFEKLGEMLRLAMGYDSKHDSERSIASILENTKELEEKKEIIIKKLGDKLKAIDLNAAAPAVKNSTALVSAFIGQLKSGWYEKTLQAYDDSAKIVTKLTPDIPPKLTHGDMHLGNQFADQGGMFDMGWMGVGPAFLDFLQPIALNAKDNAGKFDPTIAAAYLQGLEKGGHALLPVESEHLADLMAATFFRSIATRLMAMTRSEKISDITKSPVELTERRQDFIHNFYNTPPFYKENPMRAKTFLIATEIALKSDATIVSHIEKSGAVFHRGKVENFLGEKGADTFKTLAALGGDKVHFVHVGPQDEKTLSALTSGGQFFGLIVGPEKVPADAMVQYMGRAGSGVNNLPITEKEKAGDRFAAANSPGGNAPGTAFHAVRSILELTGCQSLAKKKIAIMGAGAIGSLTAEYLLALGAENVIIYNRSEVAEKNRVPGASYTTSKEDALRNADITSLHIPLTDDTKGFISSSEIKLMAEGAQLINFARPQLIDPVALESAVKSSRIGGFAIDGDLFADGRPTSVLTPYMHLKSGMLLPHIGGDTAQQDRDNVICTHVDQCIEFAKSGVVNNLKSSEASLPDGTKKGAATDKKIYDSKPQDFAMRKLSEKDQQLVLRAVLDASNVRFTPLTTIANLTRERQLYTGTTEFKTLYGFDFRGQEVQLPVSVIPDNAEGARAAASQIIGTMGGKYIEKKQELAQANDNDVNPRVGHGRRNSVDFVTKGAGRGGI